MSLESALPEPIRSRYALKLLGVSLLIVLVIAALIAAAVIAVSDRVQDDQLESVETNAELEARALGQWIEGKQQVIRTMSRQQRLSPASDARTQAALEHEQRNLSPEIATLSVVERSPETDSNGTNERIVASTETESVGRPLSVTDANWKPTVGFNFEDTGDVILSFVYTDDNATFVAIASPTPDGEHALVAEYRTSVRADRFTSVLPGTETLVLGGFTAFVLFDENESRGIVPYEGDRENTTIGSTILDSEPTAELGGSVLTGDEVKGYSAVPGDGVDWVVVKEVPRSAALETANRVQRDLWLVVAVVVAGFLLVGIVIQRGPIRSIRRLATQANAIAEGNLSVDIDGSRTDEVGEVQSAFENTRAYIETITEQADALSRQAFDDDVLDEDVPGRVGDSMSEMHRDLQRLITRLEVFNRVLRHNLSNQIDIINSHAEELEENEHREAVLSATDRLATLGTRARRIDQLMSKDPQPTTVELAERIEMILTEIESDGVSIETSMPEDTTVSTDVETLDTVLRSPLENAVAYAEATVDISVESTEDGCTVEISDDGPGIPAAELESLATEHETPLQHSRGLGLWELKWGVDKLGGTLSFATEDGTTVVIQVPDLG